MNKPRPKIAVNYSPQAAELLTAGEVSFELWKRSAPESSAAPHEALTGGKPTYVHFPFEAGKDDLLKTDWDAVERVLEATGTPMVNVHLNAKRADFPGVDLEKERSAVRDRFLANVSGMVRRFGPERVIAENVIYRGEDGPYLRASVEPDLITEIVESTGCRFLLDTAHATITSNYLGIDRPHDYVVHLPVGNIGEIHVTGAVLDGNRLRDSMPMTEADWELAEWCIGNAIDGRWGTPWTIALEYGGIGPTYEWRSDPVVIAKELPRLSGLIR